MNVLAIPDLIPLTRALRENPEDKQTRLVLSDLLEESGRADAAEWQRFVASLEEVRDLRELERWEGIGIVDLRECIRALGVPGLSDYALELGLSLSWQGVLSEMWRATVHQGWIWIVSGPCGPSCDEDQDIGWHGNDTIPCDGDCFWIGDYDAGWPETNGAYVLSASDDAPQCRFAGWEVERVQQGVFATGEVIHSDSYGRTTALHSDASGRYTVLMRY